MKLKKLATIIAMATVTVQSVQAQCCQAIKEGGISKEMQCAIAKKSKEFYKKNGAFDPAKAKASYYALMKKFNSPIYEALKTDNFWVCDFLQGDFANLGMGGIFWMNVKGTYEELQDKKFIGKKYGFLGHEIYLLPCQALPEHRHFAGPEGFGAKMEGWLVRYGSARFFGAVDSGQGEKLISTLPKEEQPWGFGESWFKCKYYVDKKAGETWTLSKPEAYHFMQAGPEGCITTEFATYHNDVRFSKPGMAFDNTKGKAETK
jgi:D-lyxose ketol-isomerase